MRPRERRLAVVSDAVYPWNTGGKEMRYHELLRRLAASGTTVDVYTMKWWRGERSISRDGVTYHAISPLLPLYAGNRRSVLQAVVFSLMSLRLVTRQYDVLEADAIPFLQLFPLKLVALVRRRLFVVTWHELWGPAYWAEYLGRPGRLAAMVEAWAIRLPNRIIAASRGTADRIRHAAAGYDIDVRVVPNGVDPDEVDLAVADGGQRTAQADLLVVGRLLGHKKVDLVLDAMVLLRGRGHDLRLSIIGEGPDEQALRDRAACLGLTDRVDFSGFLPDRADLLRAIAGSRVLVFPSVREGFGMVALEALAVGTPVVTSNHPDNFARELIEPGVTGEVCAPEAASLASAIDRVLGRHHEFGVAARRAAQAYHWDRLAARAAEVYVS